MTSLDDWLALTSSFGCASEPGASAWLATAAMTWRTWGVQLAVGGAVAIYAVLGIATWSAPFPV